MKNHAVVIMVCRELDEVVDGEWRSRCVKSDNHRADRRFERRAVALGWVDAHWGHAGKFFRDWR